MASNSDQTANSGSPEPSMEDILASIRRILKDEAVQSAEGEPEDDVLVLDTSMIASTAILSSATTPPTADQPETLSDMGHENEDFISQSADLRTAASGASVEAGSNQNTPFRPMPLPDPQLSAFLAPVITPPVTNERSTNNQPSWPAIETTTAPELMDGIPVFGQRTPVNSLGMGSFATASLAPPQFPTPQPFANPAVPTSGVFGSKFNSNVSNLNSLPQNLQPFDDVSQSTPPRDMAAFAPVPTPPPEMQMPVESPMPDPVENSVIAPKNLIDDQVSSAAASAIGAMVRNISAEKSVAISRGGATIEDMVREEIRPLLKAWLDSNLPGLVERVVRTEIEKVVSRSLD